MYSINNLQTPIQTVDLSIPTKSTNTSISQESLCIRHRDINKSKRNIFDSKKTTLPERMQTEIRIRKYQREKDEIKQIKALAEKWREENYKLKNEASEGGLTDLAAQLDLGSNIAGEIADHEEEDSTEFFMAYTIEKETAEKETINPEAIAITSSGIDSCISIDFLVVAPSNIKNVRKINSGSALPDRIPGIGTRLIKEIALDGINQGKDGSIETNAADLSIGFYEHLGFQKKEDEDLPNLMHLSPEAAKKILLI